MSGVPSYELGKLSCSPLELAKQHYAIVVADWNSDITYTMADDAVHTLVENGIPRENITLIHVPGSVELVYGTAHLIYKQYNSDSRTCAYNAIIVIGCVIKGDTPHFDYVCQSVTQGVTILNSKGIVPVIFSVLTTNDRQQAVDRVNGQVGKKGVEVAIDAIRMANL